MRIARPNDEAMRTKARVEFRFDAESERAREEHSERYGKEKEEGKREAQSQKAHPRSMKEPAVDVEINKHVKVQAEIAGVENAQVSR